jgi:hypothetical protein
MSKGELKWSEEFKKIINFFSIYQVVNLEIVESKLDF